MRLRSSHSALRIEDAVRRMRAVLGVLDADLAQYHEMLAVPLPATVLADAQWQIAEAARLAVEENLGELERAAATAAAEAVDWRAKAAIAENRGESALAEQARIRAAEADAVQRIYTDEASAVHVFLQEWAVRVTHAMPGRP